MVLSVCQLLCFPFALDVDADLLEGILADLTDSAVTAHLLQVLGRHVGGRKMANDLVHSSSLPAAPGLSVAPGWM